MVQRESDTLIVLRERESRLHGEGAYMDTKHAKEQGFRRQAMEPLKGTNIDP
jgi:hypothetical protein